MRIVHKKAEHEYEIQETVEAGVSLTGAEVKSLLGGRASLEGAFVRVIGTEVFLVNGQIFPYEYARPEGYQPKRTRKLLLHRREITRLKSKIEGSHLTLVPLAWYTKGPRIKLAVGVARGKKQYEKREQKKREDLKRELERDFRGKVK